MQNLNISLTSDWFCAAVNKNSLKTEIAIKPKHILNATTDICLAGVCVVFVSVFQTNADYTILAVSERHS